VPDKILVRFNRTKGIYPLSQIGRIIYIVVSTGTIYLNDR